MHANQLLYWWTLLYMTLLFHAICLSNVRNCLYSVQLFHFKYICMWSYRKRTFDFLTIVYLIAKSIGPSKTNIQNQHVKNQQPSKLYPKHLHYIKTQCINLLSLLYSYLATTFCMIILKHIINTTTAIKQPVIIWMIDCWDNPEKKDDKIFNLYTKQSHK